jgi:hypothetical protein
MWADYNLGFTYLANSKNDSATYNTGYNLMVGLSSPDVQICLRYLPAGITYPALISPFFCVPAGLPYTMGFWTEQASVRIGDRLPVGQCNIFSKNFDSYPMTINGHCEGSESYFSYNASASSYSSSYPPYYNLIFFGTDLNATRVNHSSNWVFNTIYFTDSNPPGTTVQP